MPDPPPETSAFGAAPVLTVDGFTAPLDWLLDQVLAHRIDLQHLSILALVEVFADALAAALAAGSAAGPERAPGEIPFRADAGAHLGQWGDWLVMAATLAWLRSRLLLPPDTRAARDAAQQAEALRQNLLRRVEIAAAADSLERRPRLGRDVFAARLAPEPEHVARGADLSDLLRACLAALRLPADDAATRERTAPLWRLADALARLAALLPTLPPGRPLAAYLPVLRADLPDRASQARAALASTLLAGLELARDGHLTLQQAEPWAPVLVFPTPEPAGPPVGETSSSPGA